jgi:hypothetical protein
MSNPGSIVEDLITKYHNQKSGAQPISNFFMKREKKVEKVEEDTTIVIEKLKPKAKKKDGDMSPLSPTLDLNEIRVKDDVKEEIMKTIELTLKKKEVMTIADGVPDAGSDDEGNGEGEGGDDVNLAFEIFQEIEDIRRDINDID